MNPIIYNEYKLSNLEYIIYGFLFLTISAVLSILFYSCYLFCSLYALLFSVYQPLPLHPAQTAPCTAVP